MRLIDEWRSVLKHAWSVRFLSLSLLTMALEPVINVLLELTNTASFQVRLICQGLGGLFGVAALIARFVAQRQLHCKDSENEEWSD